MSVGIPTLILAIIAKQCHKQANKHFGEGFSRNVRSIIDKGIQQSHTVRNHMRYFTSDTHFGHPLVTALRGFLNNGRLRTEYRDVWQAQGRAAAHAWIKQYVRDNQTSFKAICDITRHENTIIGNINETVGRDDELWILGDLSYRCTVEHTLECLRRINCQHLHLIIGNHDRNFRLRSNDALYENVFETIDDYREIDMELPVLDGTGKPTAATTRQTIGMSHFPRLSALTEEHGNWPENWNKFADVAPTTEGCSMVTRIKAFQTAPIRSARTWGSTHGISSQSASNRSSPGSHSGTPTNQSKFPRACVIVRRQSG